MQPSFMPEIQLILRFYVISVEVDGGSDRVETAVFVSHEFIVI